MRLRPLLRTLRAGDPLERIRALRSSRAALDVAVTGAALRAGVLDELQRPLSVTELAGKRGWADVARAEAGLQSLAAHGLVEERHGLWRTSARGRRIAGDEIARAVYEAFSSYHTELYREIDRQLTTGADRRDIEVDGELIARLSRFMDEFVLAEIDRLVAAQPPRRLLDVGCGAADHLRHVLETVPGATAVGVEPDDAAAGLAHATVAHARLGHRAEIVTAQITSFLTERPQETFDLILLANVIYYVPLADRVELLRSLAERLDHGGRLVVVTTALTDDAFSRHFDLLLRAQAGNLELPDIGVLSRQLAQAGLVPRRPRRIAPGEPLTVVVADRL
jgi:SAM-dependent methyltransferase